MPDLAAEDAPSIAALREALQRGDVTREAIVATVRERMDRYAHLNAFITPMVDMAGPPRHGPLDAIPIAIKDFFDTADVPTTAGSARLADRIPDQDAEVVQRLRAAGAILVGKTNMDRLGMATTGLTSDFGPVLNPRLPGRIAGGSSAGSAAAIAAGICLATVDTDAGGSARLPAACCGIAGFKPTVGSISQAGLLEGQPVDPAIQKLSHVGLMARTPKDIAAVFEVLSDPPSAEWPEPVRIGLVVNDQTQTEVRGRFLSALGELSPLLGNLTEIEVPFDQASFDVTDIEAARSTVADRVFSDVDLIVLPTLTHRIPTIEEAWAGGDRAVSMANTFFANYFGLPAVTVPLLPRLEDDCGLQIVGAPGADIRLLQFAQKLYEAIPRQLAAVDASV